MDNLSNSKTFGVQYNQKIRNKTIRQLDEEQGVLKNGVYLKNPTAKSLGELINANGRVRGKTMNGQFMYVVDASGNIIIGTRAGGHMPHPTLIGGQNPLSEILHLMLKTRFLGK